MATRPPSDTSELFDRSSDRIAQQLRRMIVSLELPPGSLIDETRLITDLGCSRTPLREALLHLAHENLVEVLPRRATAVANISIFDLQQNFEARVELEMATARLAAERISEAELRELDDLVERLARLDDNASALDLTELDMAFHRKIVEASENRYLVDAHACIHGPAQRIAVFAYSRGKYVAYTVDEHRPVVAALRSRDGEQAARLLAEHIQKGKERILKLL